MNDGDADRLAALEHVLVGAAASQAKRVRRRRRRVVVLLAVAAPLVLAVGGSIAGTGFLSRGVDHNLSTLRDDRLQAAPGVASAIAAPVGAKPRDRDSQRAWLIVGNHRIVGFPTAGGSFCFEFVAMTAGCVRPDALTPSSPLDATSDNGDGRFRVYGLAMDGVTGVGVQVGGVTRRATMGRNAFYFESTTLGTRGGFAFTLIAHLRGGSTRRIPLKAADTQNPRSHILPKLPGALAPVGNTAA